MSDSDEPIWAVDCFPLAPDAWGPRPAVCLDPFAFWPILKINATRERAGQTAKMRVPGRTVHKEIYFLLPEEAALLERCCSPWDWYNPPWHKLVIKLRRAGYGVDKLYSHKVMVLLELLREADAAQGTTDAQGGPAAKLPIVATQPKWSKPASKKDVASAIGGWSVDKLDTYLKNHPNVVRQVTRQSWQFDKNDPLFTRLS